MQRQRERTGPRPKRLDMIGAWATSPRTAGVRGWVDVASRLGAAIVEKYARVHVDVLVQGGDPYVGLLSACALAGRGQRVLLHFTDSMAVTNDLYELNAHRLIHLPPAAQDWLVARVSAADAHEVTPSGLLGLLCKAARSYVDVHGTPLIRVCADGDLQPDAGLCRGLRRAHIFWPHAARSAGHSVSSELMVYHRFIGRRLPRLNLVNSPMSVVFLCVRQVLLTSPVGGYDEVLWQCAVGRVGAGRGPLSASGSSDSAGRIRDFEDAAVPRLGFV